MEDIIMANILNQGTITESYQLPSLGKLYGPDFPDTVTIRSMTTFEEKMRLGNQGFWKTITSILNAVVTSPEEFKSENLTLFDFYFMMYKMRTVSYGNIYKVRVTCPDCGKVIICNVDLDKLAVTYLPEDFKEPIEIGPLPRSNDTLQCKFLRAGDSIRIEKRSQEILKKYPDYQGDPSYILNIAAQIVGINGDKLSPREIEMYVEKMTALDSAYFQQAIAAKTGNIGMSTECTDFCPECGAEIEFDLPFNSEFFRPTFDF